MKKRYLLPISYLALVILSFALSIEGLLMLLIAPQALVAIAIERALGTQLGDDLPLEVACGTITMFLIGVVLDFVSEKIKKGHKPT